MFLHCAEVCSGIMIEDHMFRIGIKSLVAVLMITSLLHVVSCVNEDYELSEDNVSLEVTVFEEGLVVPLGSTAEIKLKDLVPLLDEEYRSYLETREDGAYSIAYADTADFSESLDQLKSLVSFEDIVYDQSATFSLSDAGAPDTYVGSFRQDVLLEIMHPDDVPAEVVSLGRIDLDEVYAHMVIDGSALPDMGDAFLRVDFLVEVPDMLILEEDKIDADGKVRITGFLDDSRRIVFDPLKIVALDFTGVDIRSDKAMSVMVPVDASVVLTGAEVVYDEWVGKEFTVTFNAYVKDIEVTGIEGRFDYRVDPIDENLDLSEVKPYLNSGNIHTTIDLEHVHMALDVVSDLEVPFKAVAEFIPYYGGVADESVTVEVSSGRYWLGNNAECCPEGYVFKEVPILDLLVDMPDSIAMRMNAGTDPSKDGYLDPAADYTLKAEYKLEVPLEFGERFLFEYADTLEGIDPIVSTVFRSGNLSIIGELETNLPLAIDLQADLLDENGNIIELAPDAGRQRIESCSPDGSPVITGINLRMVKKEGSDLPEIAAVRFCIKADAADAPGVPLAEDTFVQATLQALIPDGVNADLKDFMNDEEEEEQL